MKHYAILSLKHSPNPSGQCVFWRSEAKGYTSEISEAGVFSQQEVEDDSGYLNNGKTTRAIPLDEVIAASRQVVPYPFPDPAIP